MTIDSKPDVNAEQITLKVKSPDQDEIHFKISKTMPLKRLMEKYCERINIPLNQANFIYDGEKICSYNTPIELNMSNNEEIHVIIE